MTVADKVHFGRKLRTTDVQHARKVTAHFDRQSDLFTTCQKCRQQIRGTRSQLLAHRC